MLIEVHTMRCHEAGEGPRAAGSRSITRPVQYAKTTAEAQV